MWYTIESQEDWLSRLAGRFLGNVQDWAKIYESNKDIIGPNPDKIVPGMRIWIPVDGKPRPDSPQSTASAVSPKSPAQKAATTNKVMIASGIGLGLLALFTMFRKK